MAKTGTLKIIIDDKGLHPQLGMLKLGWNYPDNVLNKILWVTTPDSFLSEEKAQAIGFACGYLEFMEAYEYETPEDAWEEWCRENDLIHEIGNNPYT